MLAKCAIYNGMYAHSSKVELDINYLFINVQLISFNVFYLQDFGILWIFQIVDKYHIRSIRCRSRIVAAPLEVLNEIVATFE